MGILLVMEFWPAPALLLLCVLTAIFYSVEEGWYNSDSMPLLLAQDVDEDRTDIDGDGGLSFLREDAYVHPSLKTPDTIAPEEDMVAMEQVHKRWLKQIRPIDSRANVGGRKSVDMYRRKHGPRESAMSRHSNTPAFSDDFNVLPDVHETKNKDNRERNGLLLNTSSESAQLQAPESHDSPRSGDELSIQASNDNATKKED